jgi:hypothetical protein
MKYLLLVVLAALSYFGVTLPDGKYYSIKFTEAKGLYLSEGKR